ncbi:polysaccharide deacetylase family protein [Terrabacter sp. BE26]|uniref:polysaccharide deacetylase family protein n=1 Tax=Terrabacter sp. BE26 TaxID=2898152 RepID=UPI0035BE501F
MSAAIALTGMAALGSPTSSVAALSSRGAAVSTAAPSASGVTVQRAAASGCNTRLAGTTTRRAPGSGRTVALTFDDSSATDMTSVLKILRRYGVRATFFDIGSEDAKMPAVVSAAARDGHLVEPHTWNHVYPSKANGNWSVPYLTREITTTANQQQRLTGRRPCFFRPPGGNMNNVPATTRALGLQNVLWSVDSRDWSEQRQLTRTATAGIVRRATDLRYAVDRNHPIVLMHAGKMSPEPKGHTFSDRPNTVAALPAVIEWYRARGYRFVAMDGTSGLVRP